MAPTDDIAKKPGGLASLSGSSRAQEEENVRGPKDDAFAARVRVQQFLNQIGPLMSAFAAAGTPVTRVEQTSLAQQAELSLQLAISVVGAFTRTMAQDVDPLMVRAIRPHMAEFVADRLRAKIPVDIARDTASIAAALDAADPKFDVNPFNYNAPSYAATVKMTACAAVASVMRELAIYDFRSDPAKSLVRIVEAIMETAAGAVARAAGPDASDRDRTGLMQSFVKQHGPIMAAALARKAAETIATLKPLSEDDRRTWYASADPIGEAIASYRDMAHLMEGALLALERIIKNPQPAAPGGLSPSGKS